MTMRELISETMIRHAEIVTATTRMCEDHAEFRLPDEKDGELLFRVHFGSMLLEPQGDGLKVQVRAVDETKLCYMKMGVARHMEKYLGTTDCIRWSGDGDTSETPVFFREITVVSSEQLTPHMRRVRLSGQDLARFAIGGIHIRLMLPPKGRTPVWPKLAEDGQLKWPEGDDALTVRIYTIRNIDVERGLVDIDFVMHPGLETPASQFAQSAQPGDVVGMFGPGGEHNPDCRHLLMLGDDTAIPAIARILGNLPEDRTAEVWIEVDSPADILPLDCDRARVNWLFREGRQSGTAGLLSEVVRNIDRARLPEDTFIWVGCEFADFKLIRGIVRSEWEMPKGKQLVVSYWRREKADAVEDSSR
jgi:NADPH-dependent ferric siderophore reductase